MNCITSVTDNNNKKNPLWCLTINKMFAFPSFLKATCSYTRENIEPFLVRKLICTLKRQTWNFLKIETHSFGIEQPWKKKLFSICQGSKKVLSGHLGQVDTLSAQVDMQGHLGSRDGAAVRAHPSHQCVPDLCSLTRRHMWVEFVVGSLLCSERCFSGYSGFPLSSKTNISKFQL